MFTWLSFGSALPSKVAQFSVGANTPSPLQGRTALLLCPRLQKKCGVLRRTQLLAQVRVAQRPYKQKLPVGVAHVHGRQQLVLIEQTSQNRQATQTRGKIGCRGDRVERQQPQGGVGRIHDTMHPLADDLADALCALTGGCRDGLAGTGAELVCHQRRQQQHGQHHHRGTQHLKADGDAPPPRLLRSHSGAERLVTVGIGTRGAL
ncbi:hypothetical protein CBP34_10275 [Acidovorax carolinensis]|uniref:Uncharacterized protein n=1 Tax=Acidovorax carolinensis TaxID=553814 RepID=A0A240U297_9BURK|nr:hypothetical protein CBP34_10275 [Acidovorax carolinensis]